jgi:hypothetical protein
MNREGLEGLAASFAVFAAVSFGMSHFAQRALFARAGAEAPVLSAAARDGGAGGTPWLTAAGRRSPASHAGYSAGSYWGWIEQGWAMP